MPGTRVVWSPDLPRYDFGPSHPMNPVRLVLTYELVRELGLMPGAADEIPVLDVDEALLTRVHTPAFVAAVAGAAQGIPAPAFGLGTDDTPTFPEIDLAARRIVGATMAAAKSAWTSPVRHAVNFAGGMHHAMPNRASGFCVYNDLAVAIHWLLDNGARRVAYVDLDAHHGDGVQEVFWDDPRVLTISVHESGVSLFPGTGYAQETGGPQAEGSVVNVALPAGTSGAAWLRAVEAVVPPLLREFAPDVLVTQHGTDAHGSDQLTHLRVSVEHQHAAALLMRDLADRYANGRWVATGGGGYTVVEVVPRVWAGLVAISAGVEIDAGLALPTTWAETVGRLCRVPAPRHWGDGVPGDFTPFSRGFDPADPVDQAIISTRFATFPLNGIDPMEY